ncbi:MAG: glycosyltransferase family 1 protein [bacterium]|nr:glycosyltransferase family 1 protein [bacterium]
MKIAIDGNEANIVERVGVNQYAVEILRGLENLPEAKKHEFIVYIKDEPLPDLPAGRPGWQYKVLLSKGLWVLRTLTPYLWKKENRADVLFTPSHYTPPLLPFPTVLSVMDLGFLKFQEQFRKRDLWQLKYWGALSIRQARKIIAISESTKKDIEKTYPGVRGKVVVTHLGYDRKNFHFPIPNFQIEEVKRKYGIRGEYILFLGTLKPSKNVEGLLEAYRLLLANASESGRVQANLNLVIAGKKGWLFESIFAKVKHLGLENFVIFTDFIKEDEKPALLSGAKVFVLPSFWEGFGIPVLEAMACGTPVVVSNAGSLPEIVGKAGVLVDPKSVDSIYKGIKRVVGLPQIEYNRLVEGVLKEAQRFSWEKTAEQTLEILKETAK